MATLHQALYERLSADADVAALVSARIYPGTSPQAALLPYITFFRVSSEHPKVYGGRCGLARHRMQVDCWGDSSSGVQALADAARDAVDAFKGSMGATAALTVRGATLDTMIDNVDSPLDGSDQGPFRVTLDFMIWHAET